MSKTWKIINTFVLCIWAMLISLLLYRNYTGAELEKPKALDEAFSEKAYWYDIYLKDKKIGFASTSFEKVGSEVIVTHERTMKVYKNGEEKLLVERLKWLGDTNRSIKSFEFSSHFKDEKGIKVTGEVDEGEILFFLESAEKRKTHRTAIKGDFYILTTFLPSIIQQDPAPNAAFSIPILNFSTLSVETVRVVLEEIKPMKVGMNILGLYKFRAGEAIWWCNEEGNLIKEQNPAGFTLYSQAEKTAKDPSDRVLFDYTALPYFESNKIIENAETVKTLKVRIKNFRLQPELYENSQVSPKNDTLTIRKPDAERFEEKSYQVPYAGQQLKKYLAPDKWVLSDYKPLQDTGIIFARSNKNDALHFAQYLSDYVFNLVRTRPLFTLTDSKSFLDLLSGDYLEKAVMFTTYAHAGGLPTRIVGGFVYHFGYFYFHAWPEIWLQEWIPVDPTLAQFPADATHIPLREGLEEITGIVDDLKVISIEVLEAS